MLYHVRNRSVLSFACCMRVVCQAFQVHVEPHFLDCAPSPGPKSGESAVSTLPLICHATHVHSCGIVNRTRPSYRSLFFRRWRSAARSFSPKVPMTRNLSSTTDIYSR